MNHVAQARQVVGDLVIHCSESLWVPLAEIAGRMCLDPEKVRAAAALAEAQGWIETDGRTVMLTEHGRRLVADQSGVRPANGVRLGSDLTVKGL